MTPYAIAVWPSELNEFALEFVCEPTGDGAWRVEFENDQARHAGYED